eukprot:2311225-Prymnesium_polylepis.1
MKGIASLARERGMSGSTRFACFRSPSFMIPKVTLSILRRACGKNWFSQSEAKLSIRRPASATWPKCWRSSWPCGPAELVYSRISLSLSGQLPVGGAASSMCDRKNPRSHAARSCLRERPSSP